MIHNLFPTPVAIYKLDRELTEKELSFIKGQETRANMGNVTSTDNTVLRNRSMTKLRDFIESSVSEYFKTVHSPKHDVSLRVTQSWINYTEPGQYHHKHAHPNSFVSGVFYPQANRETDRIYFYRDGFQQIKFPPSDWNVWNSDNLSNYPINLTGRLSSFFEDCSHLHEGFLDTPANNERNMNQWFQTENPTAFQGSFRFNKHFNPLIGKWNMSNVGIMYQSFWESIKFIGIGLQDWDTGNVYNWGMAFEDCYIATFEDIGNWSMAGQSTMSRMFNYCGQLNEDISAWGTNDGGMRTSGGANFSAMLNHTAMSVENYSKWIICLANWAYDNSYTTAESLGGTGLSYNSTTYNGIGSGQYTDATSAATYLEGLGWTIGGTDLG